MAVHHIEPTRETLHGNFWRDWPPVLTIDPGDTVVYRTIDAGWGIEGPELPRKHFEPRDPERGDGHAMCGPVAVRGAEPGMMLEIEIKDVVPGPWGWCIAGGWDVPLHRRLGVVNMEVVRHNWQLDAATMTGRNQHGHTVKLSPFMGVMGLALDVAEKLSTTPPRQQGGNLDCKELIAGSSLFLPIAVKGALFSVGDGHALQADGEVSGTAIECPMERVELTFRLRDNPPIKTPHARTPAGWLTFGFHEDLDEAMAGALDAMLLLMHAHHGLERRDALALASLLVDLRITQVVNGSRGVHAILPAGAIANTGTTDEHG